MSILISNMNLKLVLISILVYAVCGQQAILFTSSLGFYNMRQNSNMVIIYHHLKDRGIKDENILVLLSEIATCSEKNPKFGQLSFYDGNYDNIFKNIELDYYQSELTDYSVANMLSYQYPKYTLNKRRLIRKNKKQPLFLYFTGHGGDYYFKIRERMALTDEQFMILYDELDKKNITERIALLSDSCSAITPFETVRIDNFLSFASSSLDEKSLSHGADSALYSPKSDDFTFYFDQMFKKRTHWTFQQAKQYMSFDKLKVNSKIVSNGISPKTSLSDFTSKSKEPLKFSEFKTTKKFHDIFN